MISNLPLLAGAFSLVAGTATVLGQLPVVPAKTIEETRIPVFAGGERETGPWSNFRLRLEYDLVASANLASFSRVSIRAQSNVVRWYRTLQDSCIEKSTIQRSLQLKLQA